MEGFPDTREQNVISLKIVSHGQEILGWPLSLLPFLHLLLPLGSFPFTGPDVAEYRRGT